MGCYTTKAGVQKDACVMSPTYKDANTFFVFNHVDITIYYHSGKAPSNQQASGFMIFVALGSFDIPLKYC